MSASDAASLIAEGRRAESAGRLDEAHARYAEAVRIAPRDAQAHLNLGVVLEAKGQRDAAHDAYERAAALDPAEPFAAYNLGKLDYLDGAHAAAERRLREALRLRREFPEAQVMLGCTLLALGKLQEAADALEAALHDRGDDQAALFHLAAALRGLGRLADAAKALGRLLALDSSDVSARASLADVLLALGDNAGAERELAVLAAKQPEWAEVQYNHGRALLALDREAEAEAALRLALQASPAFALALRILGSLLQRQGRGMEALPLCRAALEREPDNLEIASFELFLLNFSDQISAAELFERHREFGRRAEKAFSPSFSFARGQPGRRLRVGYVSSDFNRHPVGLFMLPLLERHDRAGFEVHCYATSTRVDEFTERIRSQADAWHDAAALSEAALAAAVHADRIDILVDLAGHSGVARLGCFALAPAPVQAAWLGYLGTTGLARVGYRITDPVSDPPGAEQLHTEVLLRLPASQWCYRPFLHADPAAAPPCARNGYLTFGSFTQAAKLSPSTRALWAAVLRRLPDARLAVHGLGADVAADALLRDLAAAGVARGRITLKPFAPLRDYYASFGEVDIALDSTPYSGGTTTCDSLWMGTPVLTLPGERSVSRSAASILTAMGLEEWIATGSADYVERAARLAADRPLLERLRRTLRARMQASPLMDEARFAHDIEELYRRMWRDYCARGV